MKKSFSDEQIVALRQAEGGVLALEVLPQGRHQGADVLQVEAKVCRHGHRRADAAEGAGEEWFLQGAVPHTLAV